MKKPRGRPEKAKHEKRSAIVHARLTPEQGAKLAAYLKAKKLTLSDVIIKVIDETSK